MHNPDVKEKYTAKLLSPVAEALKGTDLYHKIARRIEMFYSL